MKFARLIVLVFSAVALSKASFGQVAGEHLPSIFLSDPVKSVQIYPNPATEFVVVKLELPVAKRLTLDLYNIIGSTLEIEAEVIDDFEIRVKTKDLPVGYYMIALREGNSATKATFKFLKR
jgi:hypothetical protein